MNDLEKKRPIALEPITHYRASSPRELCGSDPERYMGMAPASTYQQAYIVGRTQHLSI